MILLPPEAIEVDERKIEEVDSIVQSTFRLIAFSRKHLADDLLNSFLSSTTNLQELLSIKNAQMEAESPEEAESYVKSLNKTLNFIIQEIKHERNFNSELQLFQLFRLISSESHSSHPNRYRDQLVQIGSFLCPEPREVPSLVSQLFYNIEQIKNPVIKAIYFHHELIRIHPFSDGNGRTTRIAKNWMLMFNLYPPMFIRDEQEKDEYIGTLSKSFAELGKREGQWHEHLSQFFDQEINRLKVNAEIIHSSVEELGETREI